MTAEAALDVWMCALRRHFPVHFNRNAPTGRGCPGCCDLIEYFNAARGFYGPAFATPSKREGRRFLLGELLERLGVLQ